MKHYTLEDFSAAGVDSLYRLVNIAARRANQVNKPESRPLIPNVGSKKATIVALEEILEGKVGYRKGDGTDDEYDVS